jgi:hypothetical protein
LHAPFAAFRAPTCLKWFRDSRVGKIPLGPRSICAKLTGAILP